MSAGGDAVGQHRSARHREARRTCAIDDGSRSRHAQRAQGQRVALNVERGARGQAQATRTAVQ